VPTLLVSSPSSVSQRNPRHSPNNLNSDFPFLLLNRQFFLPLLENHPRPRIHVPPFLFSCRTQMILRSNNLLSIKGRRQSWAGYTHYLFFPLSPSAASLLPENLSRPSLDSAQTYTRLDACCFFSNSFPSTANSAWEDPFLFLAANSLSNLSPFLFRAAFFRASQEIYARSV